MDKHDMAISLLSESLKVRTGKPAHHFSNFFNFPNCSNSCTKPLSTGKRKPEHCFLTFINLEHEIYDIGTEILYETCFGHNSTQNAPKSMIPVRVCTIFCVDSESAIKTRFKALFKNWHPWIRRCCFSWNFAPGGRLNHEAYNVRTIHTNINHNFDVP